MYPVKDLESMPLDLFKIIQYFAASTHNIPYYHPLQEDSPELDMSATKKGGSLKRKGSLRMSQKPAKSKGSLKKAVKVSNVGMAQ